jgi:hypothetical protein
VWVPSFNGSYHLFATRRAYSETNKQCGDQVLTVVPLAISDDARGLDRRRLSEQDPRIGGVPEENLYDRMKTVWLGTDERGEIVWHPVFLDFACYWGLTPRRAVSRTDERESGSGREVRAAELSVWLARTRTRQPERSECAAARVDWGCRQPARARDKIVGWEGSNSRPKV